MDATARTASPTGSLWPPPPPLTITGAGRQAWMVPRSSVAAVPLVCSWWTSSARRSMATWSEARVAYAWSWTGCFASATGGLPRVQPQLEVGGLGQAEQDGHGRHGDAAAPLGHLA